MKGVILCDVGGTNLSFFLVKFIDKNFQILEKQTLKTSSIKNFKEFFSNLKENSEEKYNLSFDFLYISLAGKIDKNKKCHLTNVNLIFDKDLISKFVKFKKIILLNDLEAQGYSLTSPNLKIENITLNKFSFKVNVRKIIASCGTGFGVCFITQKNEIISTEVGQSNFCFFGKLEIEFQEFLKKRNNKNEISINEILSGKGLECLYEFLSKKKMSAKEISLNKNNDNFAKESFELFFLFYARVLKNLSLIFLCDEIFLSGGIIEKNKDFLNEIFKKEFLDQGLFYTLLNNIEIFLIENYNSNVFGLLEIAKKEIGK